MEEQVAKSFSSHGDLRTLLLLFIRHGDEIGCATKAKDILDCLPLTIPISEYDLLLHHLGVCDKELLRIYVVE